MSSVLGRRFGSSNLLPILVVTAVLLVFWYGMAIKMNASWQHNLNGRAEVTMSAPEFAVATWSQKKPLLPAPHQIAGELYKTVFQISPTSKKSLVFHGWITLSSTMLGFVFGTCLGVGLAVAIVHNRASDRSLMPWIIASQTIPILAIAPMFIVVLSAVGVQGLVPKALISTYLSFFPVVVGMVKGLRSPRGIQLDLMRTFSASASQTFWKLRWPSALPYLFASMKIGIAASVVGAIVAELTAGGGGLGARLLSGSYYGQTLQIWAALFASAILAATLIFAVESAQKQVNARMGFAA